jgi:hypothetical protein
MRTALPSSMLAALLLTAALPVSAALTLQLDATGAVASGATAGQSVVFFALTRTEARYQSVYATHREIVSDGDADGVVRFEPPAGVAWKSVFLAVDLTSGEVAVAAPEGFPLTEAPTPTQVQRGTSGALDKLHVADRRAEVTVVRPGVGAWGALAYDGGPSDKDAELYDEMELDPADLSPLGSVTTALTSLSASDLVLVIHPEFVFYSVYQVKEVEP